MTFEEAWEDLEYYINKRHEEWLDTLRDAQDRDWVHYCDGKRDGLGLAKKFIQNLKGAIDE